MGSISGEEVVEWDGHHDNSSAHHEEKIYVAVRVRPLSEREISKNDLSDWECINNNTIIFKNTIQERSQLPSAYSFDRVFGFNSPTRKVYEEAAKKVALSVLGGINSTIFAYGQTGSGKTFTMRGITECAMADIYDYIQKHHHERKFVMKFSAMEIYNEVVRDLLRSENTALRLLDDPERGTVVDKLTEVTIKDTHQLKELLSICEAQRQIGETNLNELSSRSHQILRLTVESEALHYLGARNPSTLTASVNFVDLAGSERASQTHSAGTRLKEGCHINRSLLSLGTVIRKLSKGRNGHIPYRDSKLTRILQTSLGGNARTAIICTMSPAHSHVEQSRNTLHFANCAKQVTTNAQVNVVMSEKALVKQLQMELARLESELKSLRSQSKAGTPASALKEKELLIQKMDREMRELAQQRDMAQSRVEDMMRSGSEHLQSHSWSHDGSSWTDEYPMSEASEIMDPFRFDVVSRASHSGRYEGIVAGMIEDQFAENNEDQFLSGSTSPRQYIDKFFGPDPCQGWEKISQETNRSSRGSNFSTVNDRRNSISKNSLPGASSPRNRNSSIGTSSPRRTSSIGTSSPHNKTSFSSMSSPRRESTSSPRNKNSSSSISSPRRESTSSPRNRNSSSSISSPRRESTTSPRNRARPSGQSLASSDFFDASERTKNCEAILASIMKGANENEKTPCTETAIQEKLSSKKTLAALLRENSLRFSDARSSDYSRQDSGRFSDARGTLYFISDELARQDSGRFSDVNSPTSSDVLLSRQSSRNSFRREQNVESPRKESTAMQGMESPRREFISKQNIESPRKEYAAKQRQGSVKEENVAVKPKAVKQIIQDQETKIETRTACPKETAEGKTKKEKKSSSPEETAPVKAKKERTISCQEEVAEGKTKKESKSSSPEENASIKAKKERTVSCPEETSAAKTKDPELSAAEWKAEFERRKREIIELWDECQIPLVHRSYFCLLFKGDPSDAVYMEVEHRRLTFLKAGGKDAKDDVPSSPKALQREREMLSKRMMKKMTTKEREALFQKWGIDVKTKQRRQQLCRKLWTDTKDMEHVNESAAIVAQLAGLNEAGKAPKEMFGLSLVPKQNNTKGFSWKHPIPSISIIRQLSQHAE